MGEGLSPVSQRDAAESPFSEIISALADRSPGFRAAVFFDDEGETVDYHSFLEPFQTRLTAAHLGVVVSSARQRFSWLGMGQLTRLEIVTDRLELVTAAMGDGYHLAVVVEAGAWSPELEEEVQRVVVLLREEAGL
jgi:predicted regulator of Ras-like GTPase activity (Roadblock/LC7/MglB family)